MHCIHVHVHNLFWLFLPYMNTPCHLAKWSKEIHFLLSFPVHSKSIFPCNSMRVYTCSKTYSWFSNNNGYCKCEHTLTVPISSVPTVGNTPPPVLVDPNVQTDNALGKVIDDIIKAEHYLESVFQPKLENANPAAKKVGSNIFSKFSAWVSGVVILSSFC